MPPTVIVFLAELLKPEQRASMDELFHVLAREVSYDEQGYGKQDIGSWSLYNFVGPVEGVSEEDAQRLGVHVSIGGMSESDPVEERPQLIDTIGYYPKERIVCDAVVSDEANHRLVGIVALRLAELLQGHIDLNFAAFPVMHPERFEPQQLKSNFMFTNDVDPNSGEIIPWHYDGPGHVYEIMYNQGEWYYNVVDCSFFKNI